MSGTVQALTKSLIFSKSKEVWIFFSILLLLTPPFLAVKAFLSFFSCPAFLISLFLKLLASINNIKKNL